MLNPSSMVTVDTDIPEEPKALAVEGRRLLVEFTCGRCHMTQCIPYVENPACGAYANLRKHDIPNGWQHDGTYTPLFCPNCKRSFERFMNGLA